MHQGDKVFDFITGIVHEAQSVREGFVRVVPTPSASGRILFGPNISAKSIRSRYNNRVSRSMGGSVPNFSELGAYDNEFIYDEPTADLWVNNVLDALSQPPLIVKVSTYWKFLNLNIGDTVLFDSPIIPENARPGVIGRLTYMDMADRSTVKNVYTTGNASQERGDYILIDDEVMEVTGRGYGHLLVNRGALGSQIKTHKVGANIRLFTSKYQVKSKAININALAWAITLERTVPNYVPKPFLAASRRSASTSPTVSELISNFYPSTVNGLINEVIPNVKASGLVMYGDLGAQEINSDNEGRADVNPIISGA